MKSTYQILHKRTFLSYIDIKTKKKTKKSSAVSEWDILPVDYFSHVQQHASTTALFCVFTLNNTAIIKHLHLSICQVIL